MKLGCGDRVTEIDGRHVGRVEAIHHGAFVQVRWEDTGWVSMLPLAEVVLVDRAATTGAYSAQVARNRARIGLKD